MPTRSSLHDDDFYAGAQQQAALLRDGRVAEADLVAIAEEIESLGKTEKHELVSRLTVLLLDLLKRQAQPALPGGCRSPMRATRSPICWPTTRP
jgi:hypothetical protein